MREQITQRMLDLRLEWLNKALGRPLAAWTKTEKGCKGNIGNLHLDKYQGYCIEEIDNEAGGVHQPFGSRRHTKSEIVDLIDAILEAMKMPKPLTVTVTFSDAEPANYFRKMALESIGSTEQLSGARLGILRDSLAKAKSVS